MHSHITKSRSMLSPWLVWLRLFEYHPMHWEVTGSISDQGTNLYCLLVPQWRGDGEGKGAEGSRSMFLIDISLSFPLSQINKKYRIRKKHTIYSLSIQFLFSGFIPAYLKTFLFTIYALTELSLLVLNNQIIGTGQDWKRRMCDLSISETYHRRCFSQQPLLYFSKFCSAKIGLKVVLWYDK